MSQQANFQVFQASAGSGKTYTIVKEYLKLCLGSEQQVDNFRHILAITFTNASANDMKAKIVKQLHEIVAEETPNSMAVELVDELGISEAELKRNAQLLLTRIIHDYSSFCVSTIDAFVQKLSRAFAHDLGLPSQYTVSIDTKEVADTIVENIGLEIGDDNPFLVQLLMDFSENRFANQKTNNLEYQLTEFVEKLTSEKAYQKEENNNIKNSAQYRQTLDFLNDKMRDFEREVKAYVEQFKAIEQRYHLGIEDFAHGKVGFVSFMNKLADRIYEAPGTRFRTVAETGKWYSAEAKKRFQTADLEQIGNEIQNVLTPLLDCCDKRLGQFLFYKSQRDLLYLYALRMKIRAEFERLAQEDEVVHISEFNKLLNAVMGDFSVPFVYERIGEHFHHVFVDEFQDTSVLQWQNLLPLIDNGLSAGRMSMVVGDGKQSIYRFRSGEVEQIVQLPEIYALPTDEREAAFRQYQQNLENNFSFHNLGSNFRSYETVVQFNNAFFEKTYTALSEPFQKVYRDEDKRLGKKVSIYQQPQKQENGMVQVELYDAESQPDYCLKRIEALVRELTEEKGYRLGDITVLVRNSKLGFEVANYLNDKGIDVVSKDSILLKSSDKVQLLVNTLRYLIHSDNEVYVANVLYYRRLTQNPSFDGELDGLFENVKSIVRGTMPIEVALGLDETDSLSSALSKSTCLYDLCASLLRIYHLDTIRDAFLNYFLEEVFKFQSGTKEGIQEFLALWEKKQGELSVKSASGNALNITTIHKSKGLEFNVVIYPDAITDLDEKLKTTPAEEWISPENLDFEPIPNLEKVLFKLDKTAEMMGEKASQSLENEKENNRLDNLNLLYVAFTRAKQRLYVMAKQGKAGKEHVLQAFVEDETIDINKVSIKTEGEGVVSYLYGDAEFSNPIVTQSDENQPVEMLDSSSADWFKKIQVDSSPSMFWISPEDPMQPREWGELVHQILSEIRTVDDIDTALQSYLLEGTLTQESANQLKDRFLQMAHYPLIAAAFVKEAKVKNECEILCDHEILRPDRYAELPDVIYLIDYKTGKKDEAHQVQLKNYIFALQGMVAKEIRAFLVYLSDSIEVEAVTMDTLF
jgi:ATP-dependent exoDNAse (exonuclease V) beta subunit